MDGEGWAAYKEMQKDRKRMRKLLTLKALTEYGLQYEETKGHSVLIKGRYELWPTTHAWFDRKTGKRGRGIDGFYAQIKLAPDFEKDKGLRT